MGSNTERYEYGIATEETSDIVPALAYIDTNDAKNSESLSNQSEIEELKQLQEYKKDATLIARDSAIAGLREEKLSVTRR